MIKKTLFLNTIMFFVALLFSCLQICAMADGIADLLGEAEKNIVYSKDVGDHQKVRFIKLGIVDDWDDVYMIQLPSYRQKSPVCVSCAYENCKILAQKDLDLETAVEELTFSGQSKKIKKTAKKFRGFADAGTAAGKSLGKISDIAVCLEKPKKKLKRGRLGAFVDQAGFVAVPNRFKIKGKAYISIIKTEGPEDPEIVETFGKSISKDFRREGSVEAFMLNAKTFSKKAGHEIAVRVEKMENGDIAILFADSYGPNKNIFEVADGVWGNYPYYQGAFVDILRKLGFRDVEILAEQGEFVFVEEAEFEDSDEEEEEGEQEEEEGEEESPKFKAKLDSGGFPISRE